MYFNKTQIHFLFSTDGLCNLYLLHYLLQSFYIHIQRADGNDVNGL